MAATLDEHQQFITSGGKPVVAGLVYYGVAGSDPKTVPKAIFSDPSLTSSITNPQTLDSNGRTINKVYIDGKYSILLETSANVQLYQNLFNGTQSTGVLDVVTGASGANTITATSSLGLTAYVDRQAFVFKAALANTGAVTFNVSGIGAKPIVKSFDKALASGDFSATQIVEVFYNSTNDNFEWANQTFETISFFEGAALTAGATTDIWTAGDGNTVHINGSTTITSFGTASNAGDRRTVIFDSVLTLTNSTNLALPNGVDFVTSIGDRLEIYADSTTQMDVSTPPRLSSSHVSGLQLANGDGAFPTPGGDTDHDITATSGERAASNSAGDLVLSTPLTKQIDAPFAAGNNAGGLAATLTVAINTTYHVFIVDLTAGGADIGLDTNLNASLLLASTGVGTKFRRIGSVRTDGSANIYPFTQRGDEFRWADPSAHAFLSGGGSATTAALLTIHTPLGIKINARLVFGADGGSANNVFWFTDPDASDLLPGITSQRFTFVMQPGASLGGDFTVFTNVSSQVRWRSNEAARISYGAVVGWIDRRGKDD